MIPTEMTCNQTKCIARMKCRRYKLFLHNGIKTNPIKLQGNKNNPCINYIKYEKS